MKTILKKTLLLPEPRSLPEATYDELLQRLDYVFALGQ
jgi:hypothetical protein